MFNCSLYFVSDEPVTKEVLGHRKADWTKQLQIIVQDIQVLGHLFFYLYNKNLSFKGAEVYREQRGRIMSGAPGYRRKTSHDFKGLDKFMKKYNKELDLYVQVITKNCNIALVLIRIS